MSRSNMASRWSRRDDGDDAPAAGLAQAESRRWMALVSLGLPERGRARRMHRWPPGLSCKLRPKSCRWSVALLGGMLRQASICGRRSLLRDHEGER
jgi:hypothetical protein